MWREGVTASEIPGRNRNDLSQATALAIWTTPPGLSELRAALAQVSPSKVYLFAVDPGLDHPEAFLRRLTGLVKYALRVQGGHVSIPDLAAATAQREAAIRAGLAWLIARGHIELLREENDEVTLTRGDGTRQPGLADVTTQLQAILAETSAYRVYFKHAPADKLFDKLRASLIQA